MKKIAQKRLKIDQKNNKLVAKIDFVARCDIHLEVCTNNTKLEMV